MLTLPRVGWSSAMQLLVESNANDGHVQCNQVVKSDAISHADEAPCFLQALQVDLPSDGKALH